MEKWPERLKNSTEEELLGYMQRGGKIAIEAAKEIFRREGPTSKKALISILQYLKPKRVDQEKEVANLKKKSLKKLISDFLLKEDDLLIILDEGESPALIDKAIDKYFLENEKRSNFLLGAIIRNRKVSTEKKEEAGKRLLEQAKDTDDLLLIEEELEGELQFKAWKRHRQKGMNKEDSVWITGFVPMLAEMNWEKEKEEGRIKKLSIEDIYEISKYTDSPKVKKEALNLMWLKRKELTKGQLEYIEKNAELITIEDPDQVREWIKERFLKVYSDFEKRDKGMEIFAATKF